MQLRRFGGDDHNWLADGGRSSVSCAVDGSSKMAKVFLSVTFSITLARTCLVLDAVCSHGGGGVVGRAAQSTRRMFSSHHDSHAPLVSPRQQSKVFGGGAPTTRKVHALLIGMHVTALLAQGAYVLKYALPVSDLSCVVTYRAALALLLCYDANLVFFLVAKTRLTNGTRKLACWETAALWWSRVYCCAYLYPVAVILSFFSGGVANEDGTQCYHEKTSSNLRGYVTNNSLLTVQFVILLALFIKPLQVPQEGTQSGGALYRRVVYRNVVCTATIVVSTLITTVVTVEAMARNSPEDNKSTQVADVMPALNSLVTLCLTEIALPLGFTSAWKSIFPPHPAQRPDHQPTGGGATRTNRSNKGTTSVIIPVEAQP